MLDHLAQRTGFLPCVVTASVMTGAGLFAQPPDVLRNTAARPAVGTKGMVSTAASWPGSAR